MLKFYTDIIQLTPENRRRVFPLLFDWFYLENPKVKEYFIFVDTIEAADVCILPVDLGFYLHSNRKHEVNLFIASAKKQDKKVWVYSAGDFGTSFSDEVITFRLGGFHSKMNAAANDDTFKSDNFKASPNEAFGSSFNEDEDNDVPF